MVAKLSGFAKFDLDIKLSCDSFMQMFNNMCAADQGFKQETFEQLLACMQKAFAEGATPPFAGDLENETYKGILQAIRNLHQSESK